jgi:signal transduction protein with GAF and PtsI domain
MAEKGERRFYLRHFKSISHAISTYEDLNLLIRHMVEGVSRTFKIKGCCILLFDDREQQLFMVGCHGISEKYLNKGPIFVDDKHSVITVGKPVYIENMQEDPRVQYPEAAAEEHFVSMMSIPIKCRDAVTGVLRMYHGDPLLLHESDVDALCVLTEQLGVVIENNGLRNFLDGLKHSMGSLPLRLLKGL